MKYHEMTKNYIFREFECGLTIEETAELCFKSVRTVKEWDRGKDIPKECKRLMRNQCRLELSHNNEWQGFKMSNQKLELPTGQKVSPQELLTGIALLSINSELELKISSKLLKLARAIGKIKGL
ncbi:MULTISPECIES: phage protein [Vibrionaceae]|uniref:phage protein n=1 Tax=Vibrionaceae TaxID=641 RepID=UPI0006CD9AE6|nr:MULTISPECIES: phage protein [Vibrionaceae]AXN34757.1 regulator [Vibrio coralliilyticus]KPH25053.1 regulator [Vibrio coralliilyticus]